MKIQGLNNIIEDTPVNIVKNIAVQCYKNNNTVEEMEDILESLIIELSEDEIESLENSLDYFRQKGWKPIQNMMNKTAIMRKSKLEYMLANRRQIFEAWNYWNENPLKEEYAFLSAIHPYFPTIEWCLRNNVSLSKLISIVEENANDATILKEIKKSLL